MTEILGAATTATKLFLEVNQISIDNWTFKLFYKATTSLLLGCSVIASSKQFFGDPINCEVVSSGLVYPKHQIFTSGTLREFVNCFKFWDLFGFNFSLLLHFWSQFKSKQVK